MITTTLENLSCSDILWIPRGGGGGTQLDGVLIGLKSQLAELAKSSTAFLAICHTWRGERPQSLCTILFLLDHVAHAMAKKTSKSWSVEWERISIAKSRKDFLILCVRNGFSGHRLQTKDEKSQLRRAWSMLLASLPQTGLSLLCYIPLHLMVSIVGRPLTRVLQAKILIFAWWLRC